MVLQSLGLSITDLEAAGADPYYLITCRMLYNEFSGDLEDAYKNKDVMVEVAEERKDDPTRPCKNIRVTGG